MPCAGSVDSYVELQPNSSKEIVIYLNILNSVFGQFLNVHQF